MIKIVASDLSFKAKVESFIDSALNRIRGDAELSSVLPKIKQITVYEDSSMVEEAGFANSLHNTIKLNYRMLKDTPRELEETVNHELAHLIADRLINANARHGSVWKKVMKKLGFAPNTYHNYKFDHIEAKTASFKCLCSTHQVSLFQSEQILTGELSSKCPKCRALLVKS